MSEIILKGNCYLEFLIFIFPGKIYLVSFYMLSRFILFADVTIIVFTPIRFNFSSA